MCQSQLANANFGPGKFPFDPLVPFDTYVFIGNPVARSLFEVTTIVKASATTKCAIIFSWQTFVRNEYEVDTIRRNDMGNF